MKYLEWNTYLLHYGELNESKMQKFWKNGRLFENNSVSMFLMPVTMID
jgi:hypothetical protein